MNSKCIALLNSVENCRRKWEERKQFEIVGVKNLSMSDLDTIELYAETIQRTGSILGLMQPLGNVKLVFDKFNINTNDPFSILQ